MFKRLRWMSMGAAAGVGASVWAQYRLRRTLDQHPSARVSVQAAVKARQLGLEVREAILDGRDAMVAREETLRSELDARLVPIRPDEGSDGVARRLRRRSARQGRDARFGPDGGRDGARLRVVDASSERLGPAPPQADQGSSFSGHPSLGRGGASSTGPGGQPSLGSQPSHGGQPSLMDQPTLDDQMSLDDPAGPIDHDAPVARRGPRRRRRRDG